MKHYMTSPCAECPWRTDVPPGRFPPDRFVDLAETAYDMSIVQFACHKSADGAEIGCAGFILRGAVHNLGARMAAINGRLSPGDVSSDEPLHSSYCDMAVSNGVPPHHPALTPIRDPS